IPPEFRWWEPWKVHEDVADMAEKREKRTVTLAFCSYVKPNGNFKKRYHLEKFRKLMDIFLSSLSATSRGGIHLTNHLNAYDMHYKRNDYDSFLKQIITADIHRKKFRLRHLERSTCQQLRDARTPRASLVRHVVQIK
ncbi:unnamed protein product, partial [Ceratitis capitata]